jgi:hypothetical protein
MAWYEEWKSATSNVSYSVWKFSSVHNPVVGFVTSSHLAEVELHLAQRLCEDDV